MNKLIAIVALTIFAIPAAAHSHNERDRFEQRRVDPVEHFEQRISQGVARGDLSHREAARLRDDLRNLRRMERRAAQDGRVDLHERRHLERTSQRLETDLRRERHDHQRR